MVQLQQSDVRNGLLRALSADDFAFVRDQLTPIELKVRERMIMANKAIDEVHFPESGYISLVWDHTVEIGLTGREGMVGISLALDCDRTPFDAVVQLSGQGFSLSATQLKQAMEARPSLHRVLLRYMQTLYVQVSSTAYVNAEYTLPMRLARWLLMCHDRVDGDEFSVTHDFLSLMLGVRRAGVTTTLHVLEGDGAIRAKRGHITVLNREHLERLAEDGYGVAEAEYARLLTK
jgi:CRP-like cAMP-binding protein